MTEPEADLPLAETGISTSPKKAASRGRGRVKLVFIPAVWLLLFTGGVLGLYFQPPGLQAFFRWTGLTPGGGTDTPIAQAIEQVAQGEELAVISEGDVVALGRLLPDGDVSTLAPPFGAGDARISEIRVVEGDQVVAGQTLAVLDNLAELEGSLETARANVAVQKAALVQVESNVRASREEAEASLERAEAEAEDALADLERTTSLMERGVTTRAVLDDVQARATQSVRDVERAQATLSRYDAEDGRAQADIAVAEANLLAAEAELSRAELNIAKAYVRAPADGTVLALHVQPGERPGSEGVMSIGNTSKMTAEVEVYQNLIGRVTLGDPVTITADALDVALRGEVTAIGLEIGRQTLRLDDPAANTDARVVDVIVSLDETSSEFAAPYTNLEVIARIDAGRVE